MVSSDLSSGPLRGRSKRLLITGAINRPDILAILDSLRGRAKMFFVEYSRIYGSPLDPTVYADYGEVSTWDDHRSAGALLDSVQPDGVVLFFNSSFTQVALRVAARARGIPVYHLEHGFRLRTGAALVRKMLEQESRSRWEFRKLEDFRHSLANHRFVAGSFLSARGAEKGELGAFLARTLLQGVTEDALRETAEIRRCDAYLSFSPECFEYLRDVDQVPSGWPVRFIGLPQFDELRDESDEVDDRRAILIDHKLHNDGLFGWTHSFRREWVTRLLETCESQGIRLGVKTHPGDRSDAWTDLARRDRVQLLSREQLPSWVRRTRFVLGTYSTMQMPLAAMSHTVVATLEIHPETNHFPSQAFVGAGVATPVFDWNELRAVLEDPAGGLARQAPHKSTYRTQFVHALDGRAGERLAAALA